MNHYYDYYCESRCERYARNTRRKNTAERDNTRAAKPCSVRSTSRVFRRRVFGATVIMRRVRSKTISYVACRARPCGFSDSFASSPGKCESCEWKTSDSSGVRAREACAGDCGRDDGGFPSRVSCDVSVPFA